MSRRVVLGKRADGSFGLDVSLPGYDALTDDRNDAGKFSFSSDWTDFVPVSSIGIVSVPAFSAAPTYFENISIVNNGYIPHVEARRIDGLRIYDDYFSSGQSGISTLVFSSQIQVELVSSGFGMFYIVYKTPMALQ